MGMFLTVIGVVIAAATLAFELYRHRDDLTEASTKVSTALGEAKSTAVKGISSVSRRAVISSVGALVLGILAWRWKTRPSREGLPVVPTNVTHHLTTYFALVQRPSGVWTQAGVSNATAELVYTAQVLKAVSLLGSHALTRDLATRAIRGLRETVAGNPLLDVLVKTDALMAWPDAAPIDQLRDVLTFEVQNNYGEYGGRLNAGTYEPCMTVEAVLSADCWGRINEEARERLTAGIDAVLAFDSVGIKDISHYAWAIDLRHRMSGKLEEVHFNRLARMVSEHPRAGALFALQATVGRPSPTPALRSDTFLSAHVVYSTSRVLALRWDQDLYDEVKQCVAAFLASFRNDTLFTASSQLTGIVEGDPYYAALIWRAIHAFSALSADAHHYSVSALANVITRPGEFGPAHATRHP